jgi:2-keto-4-pentenoate hydratase
MPEPPEVDPRMVAALADQLARWRAALAGGAERVGWKLGMGDGERIGDEVAIGHLTSATVLGPGATYRGAGDRDLRTDAEVALRLGRDVAPDADRVAAGEAIAGFGAALEVVDLGAPPGGPESVVAGNVYHRAVAFGPFRPDLPPGPVHGRLVVNGRVLAAAPAAADLADRVRAAARLLGAMGERLQAGDRIITGSVVQVPIKAGDHVLADLGTLGRVDVRIAPATP